MERQRRVSTLFVLTLLQLCRAEIKDGQPQWYSANIINDGYQPKSISDIFPPEATFSTANPIIVSSQNSEGVIRLLSTLAPPTSLSSSTFKTTTGFPSSQPQEISTFPPSESPQFSSSPPSFQQYLPNSNPNQLSYQQMSQPSVEGQQQSSPAEFEPVQSMQPLLKMVSDLQPQRNVQIQEPITSTQNLPQNPPVIKLTTFQQPQPTEATTPQVLIIGLIPQDGQTNIGPMLSTVRPPQNIPPHSNYFLIYQQAPQSLQNYPNPSSSAKTTAAEFFTTSEPPITSTLPPTFSSPLPTFSTISSPVTTPTSPLIISTNRPPTTQFLSTSPQVTITSHSTIGSSSGVSSTGTEVLNCVIPKSTTPLPGFNGRPIPLDMFPLKIRVMAPSGSITNVNFIPKAQPQNPHLSNHKYVAHTTTRKPTTRRTPKPRKNTYERCLQGCRKNGQPLCAAPLSQFPVDPKTLRGFPSVCHMACHNSYRKDAYEKIIDGSCSKLRTRIRPVDSHSKLKRDELQKLHYSLDNPGPPTIVEVTGSYS